MKNSDFVGYFSTDGINPFHKVKNVRKFLIKFQVQLIRKKTKPIGMCIDIPIVNSKPIGSSFH